jgi:hypothetical protein
MVMLLQCRQDRMSHRPEVCQTILVSYVTALTLPEALRRLRQWETAHDQLKNGCRVFNYLLMVSNLGALTISIEEFASLSRASYIETLPQTSEEFE